MKSKLALIDRYKSNISNVEEVLRSRVNRPGGLDEISLLDLILNPQDYDVNSPEHPKPQDVEVEYDIEKCRRLGLDAIKNGEVAYCIMAGGAGTRMGEPKALLRIPEVEMSLLTLKLFQATGSGPIWIVVSPSLKDKIIDHVRSHMGIDQDRINFIEQYESYRMTLDNQIFLESGRPSLYPCGHGDLFPALVQSKLLDKFASLGGKYVSVVNVDNIMGDLDPETIGRHISSNSKVSCEVVERTNEDAGGVLCSVDNSLQIVESFRVQGCDAKDFKWLNTNSFIFNSELDISSLGKCWNRVRKSVNGQLLVQHERLLQEITFAYETSYLKSFRERRFFPIKNAEDLNLASSKIIINQKI